jgi:hypothetical protein
MFAIAVSWKKGLRTQFKDLEKAEKHDTSV